MSRSGALRSPIELVTVGDFDPGAEQAIEYDFIGRKIAGRYTVRAHLAYFAAQVPLPRSSASSKSRASARSTLAAQADRHALYERAVQDPEGDVKFFARTYRKLRGHDAVSMREDFCGTAALCEAWARSSPERTAIGVARTGRRSPIARRSGARPTAPRPHAGSRGSRSSGPPPRTRGPARSRRARAASALAAQGRVREIDVDAALRESMTELLDAPAAAVASHRSGRRRTQACR